ncbi:cyclin-like protein [Geopyxis carbonaria]|nr:cyclin-like protein [Geopyxis carbonaria]
MPSATSTMSTPKSRDDVNRTRSRSPNESWRFQRVYIQRSRPYLTAAQVESLRPTDVGAEVRETNCRLNACAWILLVSKTLQFPLRTMTTAMVLYHRLLVFNNILQADHNWTEAAAAALFVACKIEDTLKKSREILAASYNARHPKNEPIGPDSPILEDTSKRVIGLERMVLETTSFDFRHRNSQPFLIKFCKRFKVSKKIARRAWDISIDAYRTLAPLSSTPHALALGALDLTSRLEDLKLEINFSEFEADKENVLAIVDDLLELYTNYASLSIVGPQYMNEVFLNTRIALNHERKTLANGNHEVNGASKHVPRPITANLPDRGTTGTIRFMIDPAREIKECQMLEAAEDGGMGRSKTTDEIAVNGD